MDNVTIEPPKTVRKKWDSYADHEEEYKRLYAPGSSGHYDSKTKTGSITSYRAIIDKLEAKGYKHLSFCNGGDDDHLLVDHDAKEFGFFEDYQPSEEAIRKTKDLQTLYDNHG